MKKQVTLLGIVYKLTYVTLKFGDKYYSPFMGELQEYLDVDYGDFNPNKMNFPKATRIKPTILWITILDRLEAVVDASESRFIDIRYLGKWIREYPDCFPKFVLDNKHSIHFNPEKLRYEFYNK